MIEQTKQTNRIFSIVKEDKSLLNKKRNRNDDSENSNSENIEEISRDNEEEDININLDSKEISINKNGRHNRYCGDNIINKLKGRFFNHFIIKLVKINSLKKDIILKKLPNKTFIADLNKEKMNNYLK